MGILTALIVRMKLTVPMCPLKNHMPTQSCPGSTTHKERTHLWMSK